MTIYQTIELKDGSLLPYRYYQAQESNSPKSEYPSVLMVHGITGSSRDFMAVYTKLKHHYNCIVPDMRWHGKNRTDSGVNVTTFVDDINELVNQLKLNNFVLMGYSLGGLIAMEYCKKYGLSQLSSLILIDTSPKLVNDSEWKLGGFHGDLNEQYLIDNLSIIEHDYRQFSAYFTYRGLKKFNPKHPYKTTPNKISCLLSKVVDNSDTNRRNMEELLLSAASADAKDALPLIAQSGLPVLYLYATPGSIFKPELADYYKAQIPQVELAAVENASHFFIVTKGRKCAKIINSFLDNVAH